jgi:integrase
MTRRAAGEGTIRQRPSDGRWVGRIRLGVDENGKRRQVWASGKTRREVVEQLQAAKARAEQGLAAAPKVTVGEFLDLWLEDKRGHVRPATWTVYEAFVRNDLKPALGRVRLSELSVAQVNAMLRARAAVSPLNGRKGPRSPQTINHLRGTLRTALHDAERQGLVQRNAAALSTPLRVPEHERPFLSADQVRALQAAMTGDPLEPLISLALASAMRQGELLGLRWGDVDFEADAIRVQHALQHVSGVRAGERERRWELVEPKTKRSRRTVPMIGAARAALLRQQLRQQSQRTAASGWKEEGLVFTTENGWPLDNATVTKRLQQHLAAAGLPRIRFHDLRHTALSWLAASGVPPRTLMEIAGHSQIAVTMNVYSHVLPEQMREAASRLDSLLVGL